MLRGSGSGDRTYAAGPLVPSGGGEPIATLDISKAFLGSLSPSVSHGSPGGISSMKRMLMVILALVPDLAFSQSVPDHLQCYRSKDTLKKATYTADVAGLILEPGCRVKVPAKLTCVPATKTNVSPPPSGGGPSGIPNGFNCYVVKCPKSTLPTVSTQDQFGTRTVTPGPAKLLCAPFVPPTTSTTSTTSTSCPGYTTTTVPPCGLLGGLGFCPTAVQCVPSAQNPNVCACEGPQAPCGLTGPSPGGSTCGGTCPQGTTCQVVDTDPIPGCFG